MTDKSSKLAWERMVALRDLALEVAEREPARAHLAEIEADFRTAEAEMAAGNTRRAALLAQNLAGRYRRAILETLDQRLARLTMRVTPDTPVDVETDLADSRSLLDQASDLDEDADGRFLYLAREAMGKTILIASSLLPDLTVELFNPPSGPHWLSPYPPEAGSPARMSVLVSNAGLADVDKPFVTELAIDSVVVKTWTFNPHAEGMTKPPTPLRPGRSLLYTHDVTLDAGLHTARWVVDAENDIEESDESDKSNRLEVWETWCSPGDLPDLVIVDIWHEGPLLIGQDQLWKVKVANQGKTAAAGSFNVALKNADGVQFAFFTVGYLAAGQSIVLEAGANRSLQPGQEKITAIIYNQNAELDTQNNQLTKTFELSYVDLEVSDLRVLPRAGITTIEILIANNGPADAPFPFKVQLHAPGIQDVLLDCPGLPAGHTTQLQHVVYHPIGDSQVRAEADYPDPGLWGNVPKPPSASRVYWEPDLDNNSKVLDYRARRVVLIVIDGLRSDKLDAYLKGGVSFTKDSGLRELGLVGPAASHKVEVSQASTVFPSTTLTANASLVTGVYPARHGIAATAYYKADKHQMVNWGSKEWAPTIYGFYDKFASQQHWAAVINGWQETSAGCGGLDKELAASGIRTIYDVLGDYHFPSHVFYHHYAKGAGYDLSSIPQDYWVQLDGWDPPTKDDILLLPLTAGNDDITFFDHFDLRCAARATWWIEQFPEHTPFPRLMTLYFASVDHACHVRGLVEQVGNVPIDFQRTYLLRIDQELYHVISALKTRFPLEFDNMVFVIVADHGHDTVDRNKIIPHYWLYQKMTAPAGPFGAALEMAFPAPQAWGGFLQPIYYRIQEGVGIYFEGTSAQIYVARPADQSLREAVIKELLGNLCYTLLGDKKMVTTVIGRLPSDGIYRKYHVEQSQPAWSPNSGWVLKGEPLSGSLEIVQKLNNPQRSGDIILLANQANGYQFTDTLPHATNLSIPLTSIQDMRVPFSEVFNTASTHGSVETLAIPLLFVGKPVSQDHLLGAANIVDVAPTILHILGLPVPPAMDGRPLLDPSLQPIPYASALLSLPPQPLTSGLEVASSYLTLAAIADEPDAHELPYRARRGVLTVTGAHQGTERLARLALQIDPSTDSARELYVSQPAERELTVTVDTRDIPDGKHHLVLEGTLRTGEVVRSEPLEVIVDNCPPGLVRIDSVLRVDGAADGDPKGSLMVEVKATVEDDAGISLVELYDTPPDTIDRPIAASEHIEDGACSLLGVLNRSTRTTHCLYLKAYDQAGNYRIDRVTVPF